MIVKEAKEIVATSELSDSSLDKFVVILEGLKDDEELAEEKLNQIITIMDHDSNVEELITAPVGEDIPIDK